MAQGDHLRVQRYGYWHHGIDCGDGTVIHYVGEEAEKRNAVLRRTPVEMFTRGGVADLVSYTRCDDPDLVLARAVSRLGESGYSLVRNNCEHFAHWCKTGKSRSRQVVNVMTTAGTLAACLAVVLIFRPLRAMSSSPDRHKLG